MTSPKPTLDDLRIERGTKPEAPPRTLLVAAAVVVSAAVAITFWWTTRPMVIDVLTAVAREAAAHGVAIVGSEIVGLVPRHALEDACEWMAGGCMEVSSQGLVGHRVDDVRFRAAVFTNLAPEHLDFHKTLAAYGEAKAVIFLILRIRLVPGGQDCHTRPYMKRQRGRANQGVRVATAWKFPLTYQNRAGRAAARRPFRASQIVCMCLHARNLERRKAPGRGARPSR
jgi:UDP-N-acetylmuramoylalanine-D-glutamate ligase